MFDFCENIFDWFSEILRINLFNEIKINMILDFCNYVSFWFKGKEKKYFIYLFYII